MHTTKFLKRALAALVFAGWSLTAQASLFDIDQLIGFLHVPSLNSGISGMDTQIDSRNHFTGGPATFADGAPDFLHMPAVFYNGLSLSPDNHFTGGSFGWTVYNQTSSVLHDVSFFLLLDTILAGDSGNQMTTGGGSAGDHFNIGAFNKDLFDIFDQLLFGTTPANTGALAPVTGIDDNDTLLYALGVNIGSLDIGQGFRLTYDFGDIGLFGRNATGDNMFYLNVSAPHFVPEPATALSMALGMALLGWTRRRTTFIR